MRRGKAHSLNLPNTRKNLVKARLEMGYTTLEMAEMLFISDGLYRAIENGTRKGSEAVWRDCESLFNISADVLKEIVE